MLRAEGSRMQGFPNNTCLGVGLGFRVLGEQSAGLGSQLFPDTQPFQSEGNLDKRKGKGIQ